MKNHILIIEDTYSIALSYQSWLQSAGFNASIAESAEDAITAMSTQNFDALVLDLNLPGMSGTDLLTSGAIPADCPVIMATSSGSIKTALAATRAGAVDFLVKPFTKIALVASLNCVIKEAKRNEKRSARNPARQDQNTAQNIAALETIKGQSAEIANIKDKLKLYAPSSAPVFITGESGTGKELCAEALHAMSRSNHKIVTINCAAIPKDLLESELFGHVKGAFSGANTDRQGAAQTAHQGTLFLDEICEMDMSLQAKLLRFLESGKTRPLGADLETDVDVRIVCATNRDPIKAIEQNLFRPDLYYRLMVLPIELPPLRDRGNDVLLIANHLLATFTQMEQKTDIPILSDDAKEFLANHPWHGNIRELANIMRRIVLTVQDTEISAQHMQRLMPATQISASNNNRLYNLDQSYDRIERDILETIIARAGGSMTEAAKRLKLSPSTLYRKREQWAEQDLNNQAEPLARNLASA